MIVRIGVTPVLTDRTHNPHKEYSYDACFVGRFHPQKGLSDLLRTWRLVCNEKKDAKLAIVGEGDLGNMVRQIILNTGLSQNVDLVGFKVGQSLYQMLESSRILVFPSNREGNPIVPLEAMARGMPVVAYNLPVFEEMYKDKGIITVPRGDVRSFAEKVLELLDDATLYERISMEASNIASQFDWDTQLEPAMKALERLSR
jgi:glycosyltransferase involved in cell wall biosynthesis